MKRLLLFIIGCLTGGVVTTVAYILQDEINTALMRVQSRNERLAHELL